MDCSPAARTSEVFDPSDLPSSIGAITVVALDEQGMVVDICPSGEAQFGRPRSELIASSIHDLIPGLRCASSGEFLDRSNPWPSVVHPRIVDAVAADATRFPMVVSIAQLPALPRIWLLMAVDVRRISAQFEHAHLLSTAVEQTGDAVAITSAEGVVRYVNSAFEAVTGYPRDAVLSQKMAILRSGVHSHSFYETLWQTLLRGEVYRGRFANRRKDGTLFYEDKTISPVRGPSGRVTHFVSTAKDITAAIQAEAELDRLANYDGLTGLANRNLLLKKLRDAVADVGPGKMVGLLYVDLDQFKLINDSMGHAAGDDLLVQAAGRLKANVRSGDTVARLGGDEFTVILRDLKEVERADLIARKILAAFTSAFRIQHRTVYVTLSIGVALCPRDATLATDLLKHADVAMYQAKSSGRSTVRFFDPSMLAPSDETLVLQTDLRTAFGNGEMQLHYQPQFHLDTGTLAGLEALLRWRHPVRGFVPPTRFVPLLEEMGLMRTMTEWVLEAGCRELRRLRERTRLSPLLAVNLSTTQFQDPELVPVLEGVLARYEIPYETLELEITETTLMIDVPATLNGVRALSTKGLRIAVDDFGTGYSSLGYLLRFDVDTIKIDRSFIAGIEHDRSAAAVTRAIVSLGREMNKIVVAEGVENEGQAEFLRRVGCHRVQGYLFGKPDTMDALISRLSKRS